MLILPLLFALAGPLVRYEIQESVTSTTPNGQQAQALAGRVTVAGDSAAWELTSGHFPRSTADAALAGRSGVTLLDRKERIYAATSREDFDALFVPRAAPESGASFTPNDVSVSVEPDGAGPSFGGVATVRFRVVASWRLAIASPGRAGAVTTKMTGTILAAPDLARSPFDDLLRLVPARGEVRDALERELGKVRGLPVKVELTLETEARSESLQSARVSPGAEASVPNPRTVTRIQRVLSGFTRRQARPEDARLFTVPDSFHSRAPERLAPAASLP